MKLTQTKGNLLAALFVALMILLVSLNISASPDTPQPVHHDHNQVTNGVDGQDGIDGLNGRNGINGSLFDDNRLSRGIAISGALSQIPALSHVGQHNHTGIGAGAASYGNQNALAIGLLHQENNRSYKATIGLSGSEALIGGGASWAFE